MHIVELLRAERGAQKVSCTKTIQVHCALSLVEAKNVTDEVLGNKRPLVSLQSAEAASALVHALALLGVIARLAEGPNLKSQERFACGLAPTKKRGLVQNGPNEASCDRDA